VLGVTKVMNKAELVDAIAQKTNVSKKETDAILTAILEEIMAAVASGSKVTWLLMDSRDLFEETCQKSWK